MKLANYSWLKQKIWCFWVWGRRIWFQYQRTLRRMAGAKINSHRKITKELFVREDSHRFSSEQMQCSEQTVGIPDFLTEKGPRMIRSKTWMWIFPPRDPLFFKKKNEWTQVSHEKSYSACFNMFHESMEPCEILAFLVIFWLEQGFPPVKRLEIKVVLAAIYRAYAMPWVKQMLVTARKTSPAQVSYGQLSLVIAVQTGQRLWRGNTARRPSAGRWTQWTRRSTVMQCANSNGWWVESHPAI